MVEHCTSLSMPPWLPRRLKLGFYAACKFMSAICDPAWEAAGACRMPASARSPSLVRLRLGGLHCAALGLAGGGGTGGVAGLGAVLG
jgi:hypothetical protein